MITLNLLKLECALITLNLLKIECAMINLNLLKLECAMITLNLLKLWQPVSLTTDLPDSSPAAQVTGSLKHDTQQTRPHHYQLEGIRPHDTPDTSLKYTNTI